MLVKIGHAQGGLGFTLYPVSLKKLEVIQQDMLKNGCATPPDSVFFQNQEDMEDALAGVIPESKLKELEGWNATCRIDDWTVRHLFGYCAD